MRVVNITKQLKKYNIPYELKEVTVPTYNGWDSVVKKAIINKSHIVKLLSILEKSDHKDSDGKDISLKRIIMIKSLYKFMDKLA